MACLPAWNEVKAVPTRERTSDVSLMGLEEDSTRMTDDIRPNMPASQPYHTDAASSGYAEQNAVLAKAGDDFMKALEKRATIGIPPMAFPRPHLLTTSESSLPTLKHQTCTPNRFPSLSNGELAARAEARGARMSEVSSRFPPSSAYKYLDDPCVFLLFLLQHTTTSFAIDLPPTTTIRDLPLRLYSILLCTSPFARLLPRQ